MHRIAAILAALFLLALLVLVTGCRNPVAYSDADTTAQHTRQNVGGAP